MPIATSMGPRVEFITSLRAAPVPSSPTRRGCPIASSSSRARWNASSEPPATMVSSPASARGVLPMTGESISSTSSGRRFRTRRTAAGPMVDISTTSVPGDIPATAPSSRNSTSSTAAPSVSMVITNPAPCAASAGDPATAAPARASGSVRSRVRFHTVTSCPAPTSRPAMGRPIEPVPRNPIFATVAPSPPTPARPA